jgi:hypothetical protein
VFDLPGNPTSVATVRPLITLIDDHECAVVDSCANPNHGPRLPGQPLHDDDVEQRKLQARLTADDQVRARALSFRQGGISPSTIGL